MTPGEAIQESRIGVAADTTYNPLLYFCSSHPLEEVRAALDSLPDFDGRGLEMLGDAGGPGLMILVPLEKAGTTEQWEPLCPRTVIDKLGDLLD